MTEPNAVSSFFENILKATDEQRQEALASFHHFLADNPNADEAMRIEMLSNCLEYATNE